jgi:hypothetical protein
MDSNLWPILRLIEFKENVDVAVLDFFISGLKFLETLGLSKCQYLLCSEDINFMMCMSAKIVVVWNSSLPKILPIRKNKVLNNQ